MTDVKVKDGTILIFSFKSPSSLPLFPPFTQRTPKDKISTFPSKDQRTGDSSWNCNSPSKSYARRILTDRERML